MLDDPVPIRTTSRQRNTGMFISLMFGPPHQAGTSAGHIGLVHPSIAAAVFPDRLYAGGGVISIAADSDAKRL